MTRSLQSDCSKKSVSTAGRELQSTWTEPERRMAKTDLNLLM